MGAVLYEIVGVTLFFVGLAGFTATFIMFVRSERN